MASTLIKQAVHTSEADAWGAQSVWSSMLNIPMCGGAISNASGDQIASSGDQIASSDASDASITTSAMSSTNMATVVVDEANSYATSLLSADGTIDPKYMPMYLANVTDQNPAISLSDVQIIFQKYNRVVIAPINAQLKAINDIIGAWSSPGTTITENFAINNASIASLMPSVTAMPASTG